MTTDDIANTWRDIADQLTPEQIGKLEKDEANFEPGQLLWRARTSASNNMADAVMFGHIATPPGAARCYHWDTEEGHRDFEGVTAEIGRAYLTVEGRQYADGRCERTIMLIRDDRHGGLSSAQARELAAALLNAADELDRFR